MKVLVIKPSSLGDIVHGLQVMESFRTQRPDLEIHWVVRTEFARLVSACKTVDRTIPFERSTPVNGFLKVCHQIKQQQYDLVLDMQGLLRSAIWLFLAKGNYKWGRKDSREGAGVFYSKKPEIPLGYPDVHAIEILLRFSEAFGLKPVLKGNLSFETKQCSAKIPKDFVLIFPDSRRKEKIWPHFPELIRRLLKKGRIVVLAGNHCTIEIPETANLPFYNLIGKTEIFELPDLIEKSSVVVCNDSGPMHLSAAMGKSVFALFGPTDPVKYGPFPLSSPSNTILQSDGSNWNHLSVDKVLNKFYEKH